MGSWTEANSLSSVFSFMVLICHLASRLDREDTVKEVQKTTWAGSECGQKELYKYRELRSYSVSIHPQPRWHRTAVEPHALHDVERPFDTNTSKSALPPCPRRVSCSESSNGRHQGLPLHNKCSQAGPPRTWRCRHLQSRSSR